MIWEPIPANGLASMETIALPGDASLRVVGSIPTTGRMFRIDQLIATLAKKRLWLTDAYYAGMTSYVQALRSAAQDGVDVRMLAPISSGKPRRMSPDAYFDAKASLQNPV